MTIKSVEKFRNANELNENVTINSPKSQLKAFTKNSLHAWSNVVLEARNLLSVLRLLTILSFKFRSKCVCENRSPRHSAHL